MTTQTFELNDRLFALTNRSKDSEIFEVAGLLLGLPEKNRHLCDHRVATLLGGYRGKLPSKTVQVANIRAKYRAIMAEREQAKQHGVARKFAEENPKLLERYKKDFEQLLETQEQHNELIKAKLLACVGARVPGFETIKLRDGGCEIGIGKGSYSVEVYYSRAWDSSDERDFKVQTTSFGSLRPDSEATPIILLQAALLTNKRLREEVMGAITMHETLAAEAHTAFGNLQEHYMLIPEKLRGEIRDAILDSKK